MSVLPPAPNGTMMVTGLVGQSAARSGCVSKAKIAIAKSAALAALTSATQSFSLQTPGNRTSLAYFRSAGKIERRGCYHSNSHSLIAFNGSIP